MLTHPSVTLVPSIFGTAWTALEFDVAGIVVAAGPDAPAAISTPGTAVWGCKDIAPVLGDHSGTLAEYVLADSALIKPLPKGMSAREAAGLGLVGGTACQLYDNASVSAGGRVLINGASGGVGSMAVQIGKAIGLHVTTTCSGSNADAVKKLGADEVIDYRTVEPSLPAYLKDACRDRPFDAILDCVGVQELYQASPAYLKPDGKVICVGAMGGVWAHGKNFCRNTLVPVFLGGTPRKWVFFSHKPSDNTMEQLKHYSDEGKLRCLVDSEYEMENALEASHLAPYLYFIQLALHRCGQELTYAPGL